VKARQPTAQTRLPEVSCRFLPGGATNPIFRPALVNPITHSSSGKAKKDLRALVGQAPTRKRVGVDCLEKQWTGNTELVRIQSEKTDQKSV
jgi:hypothetical protein